VGLPCGSGPASWRAPDPLDGAEPGDPVLPGAPAGAELIGDEVVPEREVVVVDGQRGVDQMRVGPITVSDRGGEPLVVALGGEAEHAAGHRHGTRMGASVAVSLRTSGYIVLA
jgi:hypothetical protein